MPEPSEFPMVSLTVVDDESNPAAHVMFVNASRLLAYEQHPNFTRLRLKEGGWLKVREGTDEIDRRIRTVATQHSATMPFRG